MPVSLKTHTHTLLSNIVGLPLSTPCTHQTTSCIHGKHEKTEEHVFCSLFVVGVFVLLMFFFHIFCLVVLLLPLLLIKTMNLTG